MADFATNSGSSSDDHPTIPDNNCSINLSGSYGDFSSFLLEALRNHFLQKTLTASEPIPTEILLQFWLNASVNDNGAIDSQFSYDGVSYLTTFTVNHLRTVLDLHEATAEFPYEDLPDKKFVLHYLIQLGYHCPTVPLTGEVTQFRQSGLPNIWRLLFTFVQRGLTSKIGGFDQTSLKCLQYFYGIAQVRHFDCVSMIWEDMKAVIGSKMIFYPIFFALLLSTYCNDNGLHPLPK